MSKRILILCTGNSCRSQMAEGFMKSFNSSLEVYSAGTKPEDEVNPYAIIVMKEIDIDLSNNRPKDVSIFVKNDFDFVITVCDEANEACPFFPGKVGKRLHMGFADPGKAKGNEEEILAVFRKTRDEIGSKFNEFYKRNLMI